MSDTATAALEVKQRLYETALTLFDPAKVLVSFGLSTARQDLTEIVAFLETRVRQQPGPLSASNRSRDEDIDVQVVISVSRGGTTDDLEVSRVAYGHLRTLEQHIRRTDPNLGGLAHWCFLTEHESYGYTQADQLSQGRLCEIEATFTARVRITG